MNIENVDEIKEFVEKAGVLPKNFDYFRFDPNQNCVLIRKSENLPGYEAKIKGDNLNIYIPLSNHEENLALRVLVKTIKIEQNQ